MQMLLQEPYKMKVDSHSIRNVLQDTHVKILQVQLQPKQLLDSILLKANSFQTLLHKNVQLGMSVLSDRLDRIRKGVMKERGLKQVKPLALPVMLETIVMGRMIKQQWTQPLT